MTTLDSLVYGKPTRDQAVTFVKHSGEAFAFDPTQWLNSLGDDGWTNIRTLTNGNEVLAGLVFHSTAQFFGGARIPSQVIASVYSAASARRQNLGFQVMLKGLGETRTARYPIAVLFASAPAFYRKLGFEPAGHRLFWKASTHQLPTETFGASFVKSGPEERPILNELYQRLAQSQAGLIERTEHFWRYHLNPYDGSMVYCYRIEFQGALEGYLSMQHARSNRTLKVQDAVVTTPRAGKALLAFLSHQRSMVDSVIFPDAPMGGIRKHIAGNDARIEPPGEEWLLRIVDVQSALEQRGYPPIPARFEMEITDEAMPENAGRYLVEISEGRAKVQRGGEGRLELDIRALAAIYTGFSHPRELQNVGLAQGPMADLDLLGAVFSGPRPTLLDSF